MFGESKICINAENKTDLPKTQMYSICMFNNLEFQKSLRLVMVMNGLY